MDYLEPAENGHEICSLECQEFVYFRFLKTVKENLQSISCMQEVRWEGVALNWNKLSILL